MQGDNVKKRHVFAAMAIALAIPVGSAFTASATPQGKTQAQVVGPVQLNGDGTATVTARYICQPEFDHLWVSAKQVESRRPDKALGGEGSSQISAAWWQSHPVDLSCDGVWHTQSFVIDTTEQGFGDLEPGQAWVQFCLTGGEGFPPPLLDMSASWAAVV
jgi:hypothetical protein